MSQEFEAVQQNEQGNYVVLEKAESRTDLRTKLREAFNSGTINGDDTVTVIEVLEEITFRAPLRAPASVMDVRKIRTFPNRPGRPKKIQD